MVRPYCHECNNPDLEWVKEFNQYRAKCRCGALVIIDDHTFGWGYLEHERKENKPKDNGIDFNLGD